MVSIHISIKRDAILTDWSYDEIAEGRAPTLKAASRELHAPRDPALLSCPDRPYS